MKALTILISILIYSSTIHSGLAQAKSKKCTTIAFADVHIGINDVLPGNDPSRWGRGNFDFVLKAMRKEAKKGAALG